MALVMVFAMTPSMTLFAEAEPEYEVFQKVLDKYYGGIKDSRTLEILYR